VAVARVVINPGWRSLVESAWTELAETRLGPDIAADARQFCPVDTGALKESIEHHMDGDDLIVSASGGADGRTYASHVEMGHRVYHPSTGVTGPEVVPAEPFLRPALFQRRGE
jgi:hypothetical protein